MIAVLAAAFFVQSVQNEFFPTTPGIVRRYEDTAFPKAVLAMRVDDPVLINGAMAIPVATIKDDYRLATVFYRVTADEVAIVGYDSAKPLPEPRIVFHIGKDVHSKGETTFMARPMSIIVDGESHLGGKRKVLGKDVDVLLVTLNAQVGKSMEDGFLSKQEMVFAKGIGLVEMKETVNAVGSIQSHTQKLKSYSARESGS